MKWGALHVAVTFATVLSLPDSERKQFMVLSCLIQ